MTFTVPDNLAAEFVRKVLPRDRSRYVAEAIAAKLAERDAQMIGACEAANADPDILGIEQEWDALADRAHRISEPWNDTPAR
jgi:hypothetical protein